MKSKKIISILTAAMITTTILAGCGGKTESAGSGTSNEVTEADKEQYMNLLTVEPKILDPSKATDSYSSYVLENVVEPLLIVGEDEKGNTVLNNGAAEDIKASEDGLVWTIKLRDLNWSDGKKVTSKDFDYGIKRTLDPATKSSYAFFLYSIKGAEEYNKGKGSKENVGVKAVDDKTLEITLNAPCAYFKSLLAFKLFFPQRQDYVEKYGDKYGVEANTIPTCGPFTLKEWSHKDKLVLEKNPSYWDKDSIKLDKVTLRAITEMDTIMQELEQGGLDSATVNKQEWVDIFGKKDDMNNIKGYTGQVEYYMFNQKNEYLKNDKIRKALSASYDRKGYIDAVTGGSGTAEEAFSFVSPKILIGSKEFRAEANSNPAEQLIKDTPDPKKLLIDGLKELGKDQDPSKVTLTTLTGNTSADTKKGMEFEQDTWKKALGINIKVEQLDWAIFQTRTDDYAYDLAKQAWSPDYDDPMTYLDMFISTANMQTTAWKNTKYDDLIKQASSLTGSEKDQEQRLKLFKEAEDILVNKDCAVLPIRFGKKNTYRYKYVKNLQTPMTGAIQNFRYSYTAGRNK